MREKTWYIISHHKPLCSLSTKTKGQYASLPAVTEDLNRIFLSKSILSHMTNMHASV